MDEMYGPTGYETAHYQGIGLDVLIIQGKIYYDYRADAHEEEGYIVADLYTGETLYFVNDTRPSRGQIYNYESPNQHGGYPYMYRTSGISLPEGDITESGKQTWEMLDAYTGRSVCKIANVSAGGFGFFFVLLPGTEVYGKDGSILFYSIEDDYLRIWNNTAIPTMLGDIVGTSAWQWRPSGGAFGGGWPPQDYWVHDGNDAFSLNVSLPRSYVEGPRNSLVNQTGEIECVREDEYLIVGTAGRNDERGYDVTYLMEPGSGVVMGFECHDANDNEAFDERHVGLDHLSWAVDSREHLDQWLARLDELDIPHSGITEQDMWDVLVFRDPDNIQLEFIFVKPAAFDLIDA